MLLHGPITLNTSAALTAPDRIQCNPHFNTFYKNETLFTSDFKGATLKKARSEPFLALPEVQASLFDLQNSTNLTKILFGFRANQVCELIWPNLDVGGCIMYSEIVTKCLDGECGTDPSMCWWSSSGIIYLLIMGHALLFFPGYAVVLLLLFDPPIIGFRWLSKPAIPAIFLTLSALLALVVSTILSLNVNKYVHQQILYDSYPGFESTYGTSWYCALVVGIGTLGIGICFIYVAFCTPPYPRNENRVVKRRQHFLENLSKLGKGEKFV
uniref:Uncharacterized protein n=1 Tax=Ciona savignyi TaxID=51511 RepID=H2ZFY1_CIOSA